MTKIPKELHDLYSYYSGDENWHDYVNCFPKVEYKNEQLKYIPEDIYRVATWHVDVEKWFSNRLQALENYTPKDLLLNYEGGEILIKEILMRFPC